MKRSRLDGQSYDVIVCGGGSAGLAAAVACARLGVSTLLLERYGYCGGTNTAAMVHSLDAVKSCRDPATQVVRGVASDLIAELARMGGLAADDNPPETFVVHPECLKVAADRLLRRAGVHVLYHALVVDAVLQGRRLCGVEAALRDGRARFAARVAVDATGDADLAYFAGAPLRVDRDLQALTCWFRLGDVACADDWRTLEEACRSALHQAHLEGEIEIFGGPWIIRLAATEVTLNCTRVYGNPVDPLELSVAEMTAREQMLSIFDALRRRVPQLASSRILCAGSQLHIRESRKVVGEYVLSERDVASGARFDDAIAVGAWPIDIHPTNGFVGVHPHKENPPAPYEIPYRCLIPLEVDQLLVAGKPISTTHQAHGSTRVQGTSLATGQAAGVAAALSVKRNVRPRDLDPQLVRTELLLQGAVIAAPVTSQPASTRPER